MAASQDTIEKAEALGESYKHGFVTEIESEFAPRA